MLPLLGVLAGQPRRAEACSPARPAISAVRPALNEVAVPTNARIWLIGPALTEVTLTAGAATIATRLARPFANRTWYDATPLQPLSPSTRYTVTARSDEVEKPLVYSFTTGAGEDLRVPGAPTRLTVTAERVKEEEQGGSCFAPLDGYRIWIDAVEVEGAAFYELAELQDGQYVTTDLMNAPHQAGALLKLPTPTYRLRPVSIAGLAAAEAGLPSARATDAENEGGCSASPAAGASSLLALMAGLLGWSLWRRRRRAPVALIAVALGLGALVAGSRSASACGPLPTTLGSMALQPGQTGVPTNARLWVSGSAVSEVTLTAGAQSITATVESLPGYPFVNEVTPNLSLSPGTQYTVTAKSLMVDPLTFTFTSGAAAELAAPAAPANLKIFTTELLAERTDCDPTSGYVFEISSSAVAGAVLYELAVQEGGSYRRLKVSTRPYFSTSASSLPSPVYRLRPVAISGLRSDEAALATVQATRADEVFRGYPGRDDGDEGGCSATNAAGASSILWFAVGAVGWALGRRRRDTLGVRSIGPRARRALPLALLIALALLGVAAPRPAEACLPPAPFFEAVAPKRDAKDVPTNARLWLRGSYLLEVTVASAGGTPVKLKLEQLQALPPIYRAIPPAALQPSTRYTVAVSTEGRGTETFSFTTDVGADETAPMAPAVLQVVTTEILSPPTNCGAPGGYDVQVRGTEVAGAVMYELERFAGGTYVVVASSTAPTLVGHEDKLPSATYRIRPLAITGIGANEAALPTVTATRVDQTVGERAEEEAGGCAAGTRAPRASSAAGASSLLALMVGLLGWSLWQRRRRGAGRGLAAPL